MPGVEIRAVDLGDAAQLRAWNELLRSGYTASREATWWRSPEATVAQFQEPKPGRTSVALWATLDGRPVGAAEAHVDPSCPATVEIAVLPGHRRRGVGSLLASATTAMLSDRADRVQTEVYGDEGVAFARAHGLVVGNRESRQLLDLPVGAELLARLDTAPPGIDVRSWCGACPDDLVADLAFLTTQMNADVPLGELTRAPEATDIAAVRQNEERMRRHGFVLVISLAQVAGRSVGYTELYVSRHAPDIVIQENTLVDRAHRGRGIGRALKAANLRQLLRVPEATDARWVQTYTATDNAPMLALNRAFGFREVDVMTALEGPLVPGLHKAGRGGGQ